MKHEDIWRALDTLAAERGYSASGLAKRSGSIPPPSTRPSGGCPTAAPAGPAPKALPRCSTPPTPRSTPSPPSSTAPAPSPATGRGNSPVARRIPLIGLAQAGGEGYFDDGGFPVGGSWDEVALPEVTDPNAYALEISGDSMEPVFRDGDLVIVSPNAPVRRGDRVVVRTSGGEVMAKQLARRSARRVDLRSLNPAHSDYSFDLSDIVWIHRIVWASQ